MLQKLAGISRDMRYTGINIILSSNIGGDNLKLGRY